MHVGLTCRWDLNIIHGDGSGFGVALEATLDMRGGAPNSVEPSVSAAGSVAARWATDKLPAR